MFQRFTKRRFLQYLRDLCQPSRRRDDDILELFQQLVNTWRILYYEDNNPTINYHLVELFEKALLPYGEERYTLKLIGPAEALELQRAQLVIDTFKAKGTPRLSPFALTLDYKSFDLQLGFAVVVNFTADTSLLEPFFGDALMISSTYTAEGHWHWPPEPDDDVTLELEADTWTRLIEQLKPTILKASPLEVVQDWLPGSYHWSVYPVSETVPEAQMVRPHFEV